MNRVENILLFLFSVNKLICALLTQPDAQIKWSHEISLDAGVEVKWDAEDPDFLTMEMSAPTKGYVGIGFSPSGGMAGSDIVIGWVDQEGIPYIKDFHATGKSAPIYDAQQDYELIAAKEEDNATTIRFRRRWETCDEKHDMKIGNDTMRLIWAWHPDDPNTVPSFTLQWHGATTRGVRSVFMRSPARPKKFPDEPGHHQQHVKTWDLLMDNVHVDGSKDTVYMCKIVQFPHVNKKHHTIGFRPIINEHNKANVHHVSVYHCHVPGSLGSTKSIFAKHVGGEPGECYSPNMPSEWSTHCYTFLFSWAVGSEGEMFPEHTGSPVGEHTDETTYFKLEIHYDIPTPRQFNDSSGIRIFYTNETREYDAAMLFLGHRVSPFHTVPPLQDTFRTFSFCSSQCTRNGIPASGLRVISVVLHAHLSGRKVRLRHLRDGRELPPIAEDNHYDFNYQQFRILNKEVLILPGDELLVECSYETSKRENFTFGGIANTDEMCQALLFYYPRAPLTDCRSQPELHSYLSALGVHNVTGELLTKLELPYNPVKPLNAEHDFVPPDDSFQLESLRHQNPSSTYPFDLLQITRPVQFQNKSVGDYMRHLDWRERYVTKRIESSWRNGKHYMFCAGIAQKRISIKEHVIEYPKFQRYKEQYQSTCRYESHHQNHNASTASAVSTKLFKYFYILFLSLNLTFQL